MPSILVVVVVLCVTTTFGGRIKPTVNPADGAFHDKYLMEREKEERIRQQCETGKFYDIATGTCKSCVKFCPSGYCGLECKQYFIDEEQNQKTEVLENKVELGMICLWIVLALCGTALLIVIAFVGYKLHLYKKDKRESVHYKGINDTMAHDKKSRTDMTNHQPVGSSLSDFIKENKLAKPDNRSDEDTGNTTFQQVKPETQENERDIRRSQESSTPLPHQDSRPGRDSPCEIVMS